MLHSPTSYWRSYLVSISIQLVSLGLLSVESGLVLVGEVGVDGTSVISDLIVKILVLYCAEVVSVLDVVWDIINLISVLSLDIFLNSIRVVGALHLVELGLHLLLGDVSRSDVTWLTRSLRETLLDLSEFTFGNRLRELLNLPSNLSVDLLDLLGLALL